MARAALAAVLLAACVLAPAGRGTSDAPSPATLLARHVPILVLHPAERFGPVAVDGFLGDADVQRRSGAGWANVSGPLPTGGADHRLDHRGCRAIEGIAASPCYVQAQAAHASPPVVYGHAFRVGSRIDLQYWLWYPYDDYSPTVPAGEIWQVHEGDWEAVSVIVDRAGKPLHAAYSQHSRGVRRAWSSVPRRGVRPVVYVGLGSHANFFTAGVQPFDPRTVDPLLIRIVESLGVPAVDHTGKGRTVRPRLVTVAALTPAWMRFAGAWGEDGYLHAPGNAPVAFGLGPRGPAFHAQWRRPVAEALSWPRD